MISETDAADGRSRRVWRTGFAALVALGAMLAALVVSMFDANAQHRRAERMHVHTLNVLLVTGELKTSVSAMLRGERGYLLTGNPQFLEPYSKGHADTSVLLARLRRLTADNASQQRNIATLGSYLKSYSSVIDHTVTLALNERLPEALASVRTGADRQQIERVLGAISRIEAEEHHLLDRRKIANERAALRTERYALALSGAGVLLFGATAWAGWMALRTHARVLKATAEFHRLATTDALTGLTNRRQFLALLDLEIARAARGSPVALAFLDVDHFKRINDVHGHPAGDEVLRSVAETLRSLVRAGDVVGRIGGEEFAILMPGAGLEQAQAVSERLREAVATQPVTLPSGIITFATLSVGVALLSAGEAAARLVSRADSALYEAKNEGRNRVRLAA